jgi:hypothetical protein
MTDEQMSGSKSQPENEQQIVSSPPLRVAQLGELNAYVVYEHELDNLEKLDNDLTQDPPESVYLNFALFLFPISLSFLITLLTTTIRSNRLYELFVTTSLLTFIISLVLLALWLRDRRTYRKIRQKLLKSRLQQVQKIKSRMPPNPPVQAVRIPSETE